MTKRGHRGAKVLGITLLVLAVLAGAGYGVAYAYFSDHLVPGTKVAGIDASNMTRDEVARAVAEREAAWSEQVTSPTGFSLTLTAADVGVKVDAQAVADDAFAKTDPVRWPLDLLAPKTTGLGKRESVDQEALAAYVQQAVDAYNQGAQAPTDATVSFDATQAAYVVSAESAGTQLDPAAVTEAVRRGVSERAAQVELDDSALAKPAVSSGDEGLNQVAASANAMIGTQVPITKDGKTVATVDTDQLASWVSVSDDNQVQLDEDAVRTWVKKNLTRAAKGEDDEHVFGLDADKTTAALTASVKEGAGAPVELVTKTIKDKPKETDGAAELGRHLDVNLSTQYARFYDENGKVIWESDIVSGKTSEGRDTPTGDFHIMGKQTDRDLVGADEDHDGEPDYVSHVQYWMPFRSGGYGLHDASWRSSFGGTIYKNNGSHGCVNLPTSKAAELYQIVKKGDRVVVHT